jgi:hypothetical protein
MGRRSFRKTIAKTSDLSDGGSASSAEERIPRPVGVSTAGDCRSEANKASRTGRCT